MRVSFISTSARSIIPLELVAALMLGAPGAHAQNASATVEQGKFEASQATGAAVGSAGDRTAVNTGNSTVIANTGGAAKTKGGPAQIGQPAPATSTEPTPWHPLTDY